ncbi:piRNA biogenesis protein EXD1-like [Macrobrachium nipponense]|uniref:piRNA biogenesis protein EXD1-like n=1 Tax=Macrobrachium nipponense TaxID=159736 RepID=UPI0030C8BF70
MEFLAETEQSVMTIEQILELGDNSLGMKVIVNTKYNALMGVISCVLTARRLLTIEKLSDPKTGKKSMGMRHFHFSEITSVVVIGVNKKFREVLMKDIYQEDKRGKQLLMKKLVPPHLAERKEECEIDEDLLLGRVGHSPVDQNGRQNDAKLSPPPPPPPKIQRPEKWIIIDSLGDAFKKAIDVIHSEKDVSVAVEGKGIGRSGTLAWLSIATSSIIFLFDMVKIGPSKAFEAGLREVLADGSLLKILHDCRPVEDMLHHQFQINLNNVFDTQAAEVYLYMINHKESAPVFASGLPSLLVHYLNLPQHHIFFSRVREECLDDDESIWFERPLPNPLCEGLARCVMYLRELRLILMKFMMVDLVQITNLYLGALRDKDSATVGTVELHVVPTEVQRLRRHRLNNCISVHDPYISCSKDTFTILPRRKSK